MGAMTAPNKARQRSGTCGWSFILAAAAFAAVFLLQLYAVFRSSHSKQDAAFVTSTLYHTGRAAKSGLVYAQHELQDLLLQASSQAETASQLTDEQIQRLLDAIEEQHNAKGGLHQGLHNQLQSPGSEADMRLQGSHMQTVQHRGQQHQQQQHSQHLQQHQQQHMHMVKQPEDWKAQAALQQAAAVQHQALQLLNQHRVDSQQAPTQMQGQHAQQLLTELQRQQHERQQQMLQTQQKVFKCLADGVPAGFENAVPASYEAHRATGEVAKLIPVRLWQSTKPQPQQTLTIVTALSRPRLPMLEAQCRSWPGPMAMVLYEPTVVSTDAAMLADARAAASAAAAAAASGAAAAEGMHGGSSSSSGSQDGIVGDGQSAARRRLVSWPPAVYNSSISTSSSSSSTDGSSRSHRRQLLGEGDVSVAGRLPLEKLGKQSAEAQPHFEANAESEVEALYERMEGLGPNACTLSVLLVTELVDESLQEHLPVNSLRNQAVLLAQTPLVAMLDADMVVSKSLAESLADPTDAEALVNLIRGNDVVGRRLVVLPAFETLPFKSNGNAAEDGLTHRVADFAQQADKHALKGLMAAGLLGPFNLRVNKPGQEETDYHRWLDFKADHPNKELTYPITPQKAKFEPWYIMDRQAALEYPYDELFRGYGKNKIAHRLWMSNLGFDFLVHGSTFIVHRVHAESQAKLAWRSQFGDKGGPLNSVRLKGLMPVIQNQSYVPSLSEATAACARQARQRHEAWRQQQLELNRQQQQEQQRRRRQ